MGHNQERTPYGQWRRRWVEVEEVEVVVVGGWWCLAWLVVNAKDDAQVVEVTWRRVGQASRQPG